MKTPEEISMENWRLEQIALAKSALPPEEQSWAIIAINVRVMEWKMASPELVKDEVPF